MSEFLLASVLAARGTYECERLTERPVRGVVCAWVMSGRMTVCGASAPPAPYGISVLIGVLMPKEVRSARYAGPGRLP